MLGACNAQLLPCTVILTWTDPHRALATDSLVEGGLQRLHISPASHDRTADHVNVGALRLQRLVDQDQQCVVVDLRVP